MSIHKSEISSSSAENCALMTVLQLTEGYEEKAKECLPV